MICLWCQKEKNRSFSARKTTGKRAETTICYCRATEKQGDDRETGCLTVERRHGIQGSHNKRRRMRKIEASSGKKDWVSTKMGQQTAEQQNRPDMKSITPVIPVRKRSSSVFPCRPATHTIRTRTVPHFCLLLSYSLALFSARLLLSTEYSAHPYPFPPSLSSVSPPLLRSPFHCFSPGWEGGRGTREMGKVRCLPHLHAFGGRSTGYTFHCSVFRVDPSTLHTRLRVSLFLRCTIRSLRRF